MARELTLNRWNWSQKDQQWVFIEYDDNGTLIYHYQINPPKEFSELTMKIRTLNDKLVACKDPKKKLHNFQRDGENLKKNAIDGQTFLGLIIPSTFHSNNILIICKIAY